MMIPDIRHRGLLTAAGLLLFAGQAIYSGMRIDFLSPVSGPVLRAGSSPCEWSWTCYFNYWACMERCKRYLREREEARKNVEGARSELDAIVEENAKKAEEELNSGVDPAAYEDDRTQREAAADEALGKYMGAEDKYRSYWNAYRYEDAQQVEEAIDARREAEARQREAQRRQREEARKRMEEARRRQKELLTIGQEAARRRQEEQARREAERRAEAERSGKDPGALRGYELFIPEVGPGQAVDPNEAPKWGGGGLDLAALPRNLRAPSSAKPPSRKSPRSVAPVLARNLGGPIGGESTRPPDSGSGPVLPDVKRRVGWFRDNAGDLIDSGREKLLDGNLGGALLDAEKAIHSDPDAAAGYLLKAQALSRLGRHEEAEAAALEALRRDPDDVEALRVLAISQLKLGKNEDAVETASRLLELDPDDAAAYALRAMAYEGLGLRDSMLADLERAAALSERFSEHLKRARAGMRIFDPDAGDIWDLLGGIGYHPWWRRISLILLGFLAFGAAVALLLASWLRRRMAPVPAAAAAAATGGATVPLVGVPTQPLSAAGAGGGTAPVDTSGLLGGKYQLIRLIGKGGKGQLWEARDWSLDRSAAVKKMTLEGAPQEVEARKLFMKAARTLAAVHHPNIMDIYEVLDLPSGIYFVFEMLPGKTLREIMDAAKRLQPAGVRKVLAPVCAALECAHAYGIVHRELRPSNIVVSDQGHVKVMGFTVARASASVQGPGPAGSQTAGGDPSAAAVSPRPAGDGAAYLPPEADGGTAVPTPAFDVFSLGVCAYEMLTGQAPVRSGQRVSLSLSLLPPGLPPEAEDLLTRALDPDPARRFQKVSEFASLLAAFPSQPAPPSG
ncbi:MAG: protein kinase [Elusimicrobiota bacterium]